MSLHYIIEDIDYDTAKNALADHGFGVNEMLDPCTGQVAIADIWTDGNYDGIGEIGGFRVGTLHRTLQSFGSICRLEITEHQLGHQEGRDRLTRVFSQIINRTTMR